MNFNIKISAKEAIEIATKDAGGFLGTWVDTELKYNFWHISATSKSAKPPCIILLMQTMGQLH